MGRLVMEMDRLGLLDLIKLRQPLKHSTHMTMLRCVSPVLAVRPEGANHQWRRNPPGELSIDPVADERLMRVTAWVGAS